MQTRILCWTIACLLSVSLFGQITTTVTSNNQLWDLRLDKATDMSASDDGTSQSFNFGFEFTFFGETFTNAYMASNGCLILGSLSTASTWEKNCTQYNPSPSPNTNYTLYPFWTDLIMGENSSMLAKSFDDKVIFGWYEMWEYYRDSKNTFELWLYPNNTYEAIYGQLDIKDHDVFIGIQGNEQELETYYFHDECNTGVINSTTCVNQDWNDIGENQTLENGGSIFVGEVVDCSNSLNDVSCPGYWEAYDDQQCDLDPQYSPSCSGYRQEESVAYFQEEEIDYGYQEEIDYSNPPIEEIEQFGYVEETIEAFEEPVFYEEPMQEFYEPEPYFETAQTTEIFEPTREETLLPSEDLMVEEFIFQETFLVEDFTEPETFIEIETIEELEDWFEEEIILEEEIAFNEPEEEITEEDSIEENTKEEVVSEEKSSISKATALRVVASTITTANQSVSGTNAGNTTAAQGNSNTTQSNAAGSSGGISTSSSPSMSDQFASSTAQNNQVLDMSTNVVNSSGAESGVIETVEVVVDTNSSQMIQNQIDVSMPTNFSDTKTEQIVENIIAQNMQSAQEEAQATQEETGEYGSENAIIAVMGFLPNFNNYRLVSIPQKEFWYKPKNIYTNNKLSDNTEAFYSMAGQSIKTLTELKELQPAL
jgi:hypothetical protein